MGNVQVWFSHGQKRKIKKKKKEKKPKKFKPAVAKHRARISPRCHLQGRPSCTIPPSAGRAGARSRSRGAPGRAPSGHGAGPARPPPPGAPRPGRAEPHSTGAMWQLGPPSFPALLPRHSRSPTSRIRTSFFMAALAAPGPGPLTSGGAAAAAPLRPGLPGLPSRNAAGALRRLARDLPRAAAARGCAGRRPPLSARAGGGGSPGPAASAASAEGRPGAPGAQNQWGCKRSPRSPVQPMANTTVTTSPRHREPNPAFP